MSDIDVLNYYPLKDGHVPSSSVRMDKLSSLPEGQRKTFQIDQYWNMFYDNKILCREDSINKYFRRKSNVNIAPIIKHIVSTLVSEYPDYFNIADNALSCELTKTKLEFNEDWNLQHHKDYLEAFDALAMQVSEDMVVMTLDGEKDYISYIHLMTGSDWSADLAIGKSYGMIHNNVRKANGELVIKYPEGMVKGIINMPEAVQRVGALSFRSDCELNRHPENVKPDVWNWDTNQKVYLRFERQTVTPFPECNSFLFTIRSYYCDLLLPERRQLAIQALQNIHENCYPRKFLHTHHKNLLNFLNNLNA